MKQNKKRKGFTLVEILLVIVTIGITAAIVLVAINPNRQIAQVRNAQRRSDTNTIYKALEQYLIDNQNYPEGITGESKAICIDGNTPSNCVDLSSLVPEYLADIPTDPSGVAYQIYINSTNGVIGVEAAGSELGQSIVVNPIPIITSTPIVTDIDAISYIAAVESADGQTLEDNVKIAINTFVIGLKTDGLWDAMKSSVIMAGARTLNGALVPLKGNAPTNVNFASLDYNRKTGLKGNGSTKYLNSNRVNNADPQNSNHNAVYVTELAAGQLIAANTGETGANNITYTGFGSFNVRNRNQGANNGIGTAGTGLIGTSRSSSTGYTFRANSANVSATSTSTTPLATAIIIFGLNNTGPAANTSSRFAFYSIGESLDLALLDARVAQLMTDYANAIPDPPIVQEGLVLHLDAGNTSGTTWTDLSGNNNNGTLVNGPTYSSDNGGNFNFNGSNQFATVANGAEILNQNTYTKCVWFSPAVTNRGNNLIAGNSSKPHTLWMNNTNKLYAGHSEAGGGFTQVGPTTNIDANSWYFASATFNDGVYDTVSATGWKLYVNGNEEAASSTIQRFGDTAAPVWIASYGGGFLFQGRIAIVMIYDRVLTPAEIQQNFNVTKSRFGL